MSLINDALKRAQEAHEKQAQSRPGGAPLHVAPPPPSSRLWPVAVACLVLAVLLSAGGIWYLHKSQPNLFQSLQQAAQTKPAATVTSGMIIIQPPQKTAPAPAPVAPVPVARPAPAPAKPVVAATPPPAAPVATVTPAAVPEPAPVPPPAPVAQYHQPVQTIAPANTRLQGILYRPDKPAAIINGRTVFVGDHVGDGVVQSISPDNVILLQGGQLYELHL
jgi:hypothetical protein